MSKKITLKVPVNMVVRDRDVYLLAAVERLSNPRRRAARVPLSALARELGASPDTMRRAVSSCQKDGYLKVHANFHSNGAQLENSYALTSTGAAIVEAAREEGLLSH